MNKKYFFAILLCIVSTSLAAEITAHRVTIQSFTHIAIYPSIKIPASVVSINDSKISSEVSAIVKDILFLVGETVKKGDVLVKLDDRDFKLNLLRAEVNLNGIKSRLKLAKYQQGQAKALFKQKAVTNELLQQRQAEVNMIISELKSQKVSISIAKRQLEKSLIIAPFDAIVTERLAQVGELANSGTPLARLVDVSRIEVSAKIQPQDIQSLKNTQEFLFVSQSHRYPIKLRKLTPVVDLIQRNQEARFEFTNNRALPGTSGILLWQFKTPHLPSDFILRRNKQYGVFIVKENKAHFLTLKNAREGKPTALILPMETAIIVDGRFALQDGDAITVDR